MTRNLKPSNVIRRDAIGTFYGVAQPLGRIQQVDRVAIQHQAVSTAIHPYYSLVI